MPKASDNIRKTEPDTPDLPFEDALGQLEELVREMESDQMPLEVLIEHYERGTALYRICEKRLDEAHGRIEIIRKKQTGESVLEPFDGESKTEGGSSNSKGKAPEAEDGETETDGELF